MWKFNPNLLYKQIDLQNIKNFNYKYFKDMKSQLEKEAQIKRK